MAVDEEHTQKPHVAMLSSPGVGHVTPLLELAKRLVVDLGFQVSFLAITTDASPAQLQLLNNNPTLPSDLHVIHLPHVDVSSNDVIAIRILQIVRQSLRSLPSVLTNLNSHKPPLKALIVDPFCIEALETADDHSIPTYLFLTTSASFLALTIYYPTLHAEVKGDYGKIKERVFLPGCMPLWVDDLLPDVLVPEVLPLCNRFPLAKGIFVNTWEELEPVPLSAFRNHPFFVNMPMPTVHPIGPLTKDKEVDVESELLTWLDKQPCDSVVYLSFGSGGTLSAEQMAELAHGLELSGKRFLWVARPPRGDGASGSFFEAGGDGALTASYLPDGFPERIRGAGLVTATWAPQVAVLSHPSVCDALRVELGDGERGARGGDGGLAALRGAEDECEGVGGDGSGGEAGGGRGGSCGEGGGGEGGEVGGGRRGREGDEEESEKDAAECGRGFGWWWVV
ncbi:hypothetical protein ABKV19_003040 [Rosa sericea]